MGLWSFLNHFWDSRNKLFILILVVSIFLFTESVLAIETSTMNSVYKGVGDKNVSTENSETISDSQVSSETNLTSQNSTEDVCVFANIKSEYDKEENTKKFYFINPEDNQAYIPYGDCRYRKVAIGLNSYDGLDCLAFVYILDESKFKNFNLSANSVKLNLPADQEIVLAAKRLIFVNNLNNTDTNPKRIIVPSTSYLLNAQGINQELSIDLILGNDRIDNPKDYLFFITLTGLKSYYYDRSRSNEFKFYYFFDSDSDYLADKDRISYIKLKCDSRGKLSFVEGPIQATRSEIVREQANMNYSIGYYTSQSFKADSNCGKEGQVCCPPEEIKGYLVEKFSFTNTIRKIPLIGPPIANQIENSANYLIRQTSTDNQSLPSSQISRENFCLQGFPVIYESDDQGNRVARYLRPRDFNGDLTDLLDNKACTCLTSLDDTDTVYLKDAYTYCQNLGTDSSLASICAENVKTCNSNNGIYTALGCINPSLEGVLSLISTVLMGVSGIFALLCLIFSAFVIQISARDENKVAESKTRIRKCLTGLIVIIFSMFVLDLIFRLVFGSSVFNYLV